MPRLPINYKNSIIYKLCCNDINIKHVYIGSTTDFSNRKRSHKYCCINTHNKNYNLKVYQFIRDNGGWDNWSMIMIEEYSCENKLQLLKKEREYVEKSILSLNYCLPTRTIDEYRKDNKEKNKIYYKKNKEILIKYQKKYNEDNKDDIIKKKKKYYYDNKEKIKEKYNVRHICVCGSNIRCGEKARHLKSKKHMKYIEAQMKIHCENISKLKTYIKIN
jgi:hypothetical protein